MSVLKVISERAAEAGLNWLIGGGHAVVTHGYRRNTFDLDLIVRRSEAEKWKQLLGLIGYTVHHEGPAFLQFGAMDPEGLPIDLMLLNDSTFAKLLAEAGPGPQSVKGAKVVSLKHLIALKCHAVKYGHKGRIVKDANDVIELMRKNQLNPNAPEMRALFLEYGTEEFYEKIRRACVPD